VVDSPRSGARASSVVVGSENVGGHPVDPQAPLLAVEDLVVEFNTPGGLIRANDGISYTVNRGETLAILGESGSGKSVSAQAVMGILDIPPARIAGGSVRYRGVELLTLPDDEMREVRGAHIAMIFQDALTALNPVFSVGWQIGEMFRLHTGTSKAEAEKKAIELMDMVRIPSARERVDSYPHEFSGGMRQRVMIAMALALDPEVLIADEPTTALDVTVQAQIMALLDDLQQQSGMGLILITHDLGVVAEVADRVTIMYAGRIAETGTLDEVYANPRHPYTLGLMQSVPRTDQKGMRLDPIKGSPPDMLHVPSGCAFHPRCPLVRERCRNEIPAPQVLGTGRTSACFYHDEVGARAASA